MYLGIDIGTTATKAILVDDDQRLLASATKSYAVSSPQPGLAEQHPDIWFDAVATTLSKLRLDAPKAYASVSHIGFSGQMHSLVALDANHKPLRPAMLWNDTRGQAECAVLQNELPEIERHTGAVAMPSFTAAKLLWLKNHERTTFKNLRHLLLPKDYVRLKLTGQRATDHSDAAGTQLFDQAARQWSKPLLDKLELQLSVLPPLLESRAEAGALRPAMAEGLGLNSSTISCTGGGDTPVGSLGLGCVSPGDSFVSLGTSTSFTTITHGYQPTSTNCLHNFAFVLPHQWYRMGAMLNGASCLAWAAQLVGASDIGGLLEAVTANYKGPSRLLFLPYLSGERTPHNNTALRGALLGLDNTTDQLDVAQAVLEGIAFSLREAKEALGVDRNTSQPGFIGGGARSKLWSEIVATVLDMPLTCPQGADYWPALGAARLAMLCTGRHASDVLHKPASAHIINPQNQWRDAYTDKYHRYRKAFAAVAEYNS